MSEEEARQASTQHWWKMAEEALRSARMEYEADLFHGAINRAYYAVFYAATALFVERGLSFRKHAGVRAAVHRELVKKAFCRPSWEHSMIDFLKIGNMVD